MCIQCITHSINPYQLTFYYGLRSPTPRRSPFGLSSHMSNQISCLCISDLPEVVIFWAQNYLSFVPSRQD